VDLVDFFWALFVFVHSPLLCSDSSFPMSAPSNVEHPASFQIHFKVAHRV
jgi:hypothetical protein